MNIKGKQAVGLFVAGAAAGAVLALLYAPKSGEKTREDIRRLSRKTVDRLEVLQSDIRDQVGCLVGDAVDTAKKVVEEGKNRLEKILA